MQKAPGTLTRRQRFGPMLFVIGRFFPPAGPETKDAPIDWFAGAGGAVQGDRVRKIVWMAINTADPEGAIRNQLQELQDAQQARFAALPKAEREDGWVQLKHGEILRANQAAHDAALGELISLPRSERQQLPSVH